MSRKSTDVVEIDERRFKWELSYKYRVTEDELELSDVPGYWRKKEPCGGKGYCFNPIHWTYRNEGPIRHTIRYRDPQTVPGVQGFMSPYRTWNRRKDGQKVRKSVQEDVAGS